MKKFTLSLAVLAMACAGLLTYQTLRHQPSDTKATAAFQAAQEPEAERSDDLARALEEEQALLRDPRTRKIPEGIREVELMQANDILRTQLANGLARTQVSTYFYQGPNNLGGRTRSIAFDVSSGTSSVMLAGGVSGGVFKTTNSGSSWTRVSPANQTFTVTSIVQDTRAGNQTTWYYAGGEALGNSASENGASY